MATPKSRAKSAVLPQKKASKLFPAKSTSKAPKSTRSATQGFANVGAAVSKLKAKSASAARGNAKSRLGSARSVQPTGKAILAKIPGMKAKQSARGSAFAKTVSTNFGRGVSEVMKGFGKGVGNVAGQIPTRARSNSVPGAMSNAAANRAALKKALGK